MPQPIRLAAGIIDGRDEIQIRLLEASPGRPELVQIRWPNRPTAVASAQYPSTAATVMRLLAEASLTQAARKVQAMNGAEGLAKARRAYAEQLSRQAQIDNLSAR